MRPPQDRNHHGDTEVTEKIRFLKLRPLWSFVVKTLLYAFPLAVIVSSPCPFGPVSRL